MALKKDQLIKMWENKSQYYPKQLHSQLLIPTGRGMVYASRDYVRAICTLTELDRIEADPTNLLTKQQAMAALSPATAFRLKADTPCLAYRYDELKPDAQKAMFTDRKYLFYEKENGCRVWFIHFKGSTYLYSRNYSDKDCGLLDYWGNIAQDIHFDADDVFAIDAEIKYEPDVNLFAELKEYGIETESKLEAISALLQMRSAMALEIQRKYKAKSGKDLITFRMIHPLYYKGKNYLKKKLGEGIDDYKEVITHAQAHGLNLQPIRRFRGSKEGKEAFLQSILDLGGEGIVAHNREAMYNTSENRDKDTWIKLKRSVGSSSRKEGMGDTIDAFITGFKMSNENAGNAGLIGSFEVSCYIRRADGSSYKHVIAFLPNIEKTMKEECTVMDADGKPTLAQDFYGLVVEVDGQAISAVSRRLTHPRMLRMRFDKTKEECIYSEDWIKSQMV